MSEQLKPCQFCGSEEVKTETNLFEIWVECGNCLAVGPKQVEEDVAINDWNSRPVEKDLQSIAKTAMDTAELAWGGEIPSPLPGHRSPTEEERWAMLDSLNCPLCGGSGHVDDAGEAGKQMKKLEKSIIFLAKQFSCTICPFLETTDCLEYGDQKPDSFDKCIQKIVDWAKKQAEIEV